MQTAACPCISSLLLLTFLVPLEDIHPARTHVETLLREPFIKCYEDVSLMHTAGGGRGESIIFEPVKQQLQQHSESRSMRGGLGGGRPSTIGQSRGMGMSFPARPACGQQG